MLWLPLYLYSGCPIKTKDPICLGRGSDLSRNPINSQIGLCISIVYQILQPC